VTLASSTALRLGFAMLLSQTCRSRPLRRWILCRAALSTGTTVQVSNLDEEVTEEDIEVPPPSDHRQIQPQCETQWRTTGTHISG